MPNKRTTTIAITTALILACGATLHAGEVIGWTWSSGIASVAGVTILPPGAPNNDNVAGPSPNELFVTQKDYVAQGPVDIIFQVRDTGGTTEYQITEGVSNSTGVLFSTYEVQLGFGSGAGFVLSSPGDGLDFDTPDLDSPISFSPWWTGYTPSEDTIVASGGPGLPNTGFTLPYLQFAIDVPDGITEFTLRQFPNNVPEPASMATVSLGGFLLLRRRH
jgi:hypothetical protein